MIEQLKTRKTNLDPIQLEKSLESLLSEYCHRCGGLMITEPCYDVESTTGEFEILIRKCLSCGEFIDPTILKNRLQTQQSLENPIPDPQTVFVPHDLTEGKAKDH